MSRRIAPVTFAFIALAVATMLAGCESLLQPNRGRRPSDVEATQGEYDDRIVVSWSEVQTEDSDGEDLEVDSYEVERERWDYSEEKWTDTAPFSNIEETSLTNSKISSATAYRYRVRAFFSDGSESEYSEWAQGYALSATGLTIYTQENSNNGEKSFDDHSSEQWFEFSAQEGWPYTIEVSDASNGDNALIYEQGELHESKGTADIPGSSTFTAESTSVYHIKIPEASGSGTISVSY